MAHRLEELVAGAARTAPDRAAVVDATGTWTYRELDRSSAHLAAMLGRRGVGDGDRVAIWAPKSRHVVAAMQGVLRCGAAYVPIDPATPPARAERILDDCRVRCLITTASRRDVRGSHDGVLLVEDIAGWDLVEGVAEPPPACPRSELAYVLYTSGSTGTPKGVCLSHRNALAFVEWAVGAVGLSEPRTFANHAAFNFDLSVFDLYAAFRTAGTVCLVPESIAYSPAPLWTFIARHGISVWYSVPSALVLLMMCPDRLADPTLEPAIVIFAGEPFPTAQLRTLRRAWRRARMFNFYGPTETNVCTSYEVVDVPDDQIGPLPIGDAASGNRVWAVTDTGAEAQVGERGELYVDGPTVMLGYWGQEPHAGCYRTGDICVRRAQGGFDFVGRRDQMVKIRGHRVELGEAEAALAAHPDVQDVAVIAVGDGVDRRLVGFVVARDGRTPTLIELKAFAARHLPRYMLIDEQHALTALPRTANGKVDRLALSAHAAGTAFPVT